MEMEIDPGIKVACMGGLAFIGGVVIKGNALNFALTCVVAEIATRVFLKFYMEFCLYFKCKFYELEYPVRLLIGSAACVYLNEHEKFTKVIQVVTALPIFCILPNILDNLNRKDNGKFIERDASRKIVYR